MTPELLDQMEAAAKAQEQYYDLDRVLTEENVLALIAAYRKDKAQRDVLESIWTEDKDRWNHQLDEMYRAQQTAVAANREAVADNAALLDVVATAYCGDRTGCGHCGELTNFLALPHPGTALLEELEKLRAKQAKMEKHIDSLREEKHVAEIAAGMHVGTCDWGDCDMPTVTVRMSRDHGRLGVCIEHSEFFELQVIENRRLYEQLAQVKAERDAAFETYCETREFYGYQCSPEAGR